MTNVCHQNFIMPHHTIVCVKPNTSTHGEQRPWKGPLTTVSCMQSIDSIHSDAVKFHMKQTLVFCNKCPEITAQPWRLINTSL